MLTRIIILLLFSSPTVGLDDVTRTMDGNVLGAWTLDVKLSDDPDKKLKGKLRKRYQSKNLYKRRNPDSKRSTPRAMDHYWETLRSSEERKASKNLRRLGPAFLLFTFQNIAISQNENEQIFLSYDDSPGRKINPNKNGRIFSATGEELTESYFGHTLSYYQRKRLIMETDAPDGGKFIEKISVLDGKLNYEIIIDSLVLKETVTIKRVFNRR